MNVSDLTLSRFADSLANEGVAIRTGPFVSRVAASLPELAAPLYLLYADFPVESHGIVDFHVRLRPVAGPRGWVCRQSEFLFDGRVPFGRFARRMALAMLEWGLNWCIYRHAHHFLILHAAVVEKNDRALILPGPPGSGKSTLCAAMISDGWRLLSDELALIRHNDCKLLPIARAVSLKNQSIEVIRRFAPDAVFGPEIGDTRKGRVMHMRPPSESVQRADEPCDAAWVVFPRFEAGGVSHLAPLAKARAFFRIAENSLNYQILGPKGFNLVCQLIDMSSCCECTYSSVDEAVTLLDSLTEPATEAISNDADRYL